VFGPALRRRVAWPPGYQNPEAVISADQPNPVVSMSHATWLRSERSNISVSAEGPEFLWFQHHLTAAKPS
jgi:hypothetical protein